MRKTSELVAFDDRRLFTKDDLLQRDAPKYDEQRQLLDFRKLSFIDEIENYDKGIDFKI